MPTPFEIYHDGEWWCARGVGADIFTQGKTLDELMKNINEAAALHLASPEFFEGEDPTR